MDAQTRIKLTLGDMLMQIAVQAARIEELETQLKEKADGHDDNNISRLRPTAGTAAE